MLPRPLRTMCYRSWRADQNKMAVFGWMSVARKYLWATSIPLRSIRLKTGVLGRRTGEQLSGSCLAYPMKRKIVWKPTSPPSHAEPDAVVWVDVQKLDTSWQHDTGYYIGAGGTGRTTKERYDQWRQWFMEWDAIEMSSVFIGENGIVAFNDGRHRFAWARDHGMEVLPVGVSAEQVAEFRSRFGTRRRTSIIRTL